MQEIIKISQTVIGNDETNSVNSRDLWKSLDIKQEFTNWIKAQINSLGLEENIDFISFDQKVKREKGSSVKKEYIITLNTAKHIAMASRTAKGKEVRQYFIQAEKKLMSGTINDNLAPMMNMMMEFMKTQQKHNEMILSQNELITELLKNVREKQNSDSKAIGETSFNLNKYIYVGQENRADYITPVQADKIVELIEKASIPIADYHTLDISTAKRLIFGKFNSKFDVKKYHHLRAVQFNKAVSYLNNIRDKARLETDESFRYIVEDIVDIMNTSDEE